MRWTTPRSPSRLPQAISAAPSGSSYSPHLRSSTSWYRAACTIGRAEGSSSRLISQLPSASDGGRKAGGAQRVRSAPSRHGMPRRSTGSNSRARTSTYYSPAPWRCWSKPANRWWSGVAQGAPRVKSPNRSRRKPAVTWTATHRRAHPSVVRESGWRDDGRSRRYSGTGGLFWAARSACLPGLREDGEGTDLHLAAKPPPQGTTRKSMLEIVRTHCLVVLFTT